MKSFFGILLLALALTCASSKSISESITDFGTDTVLSRAGDALGVEGVSLDKLTSQDGLTELATDSALKKAGDMIGVEGLTLDKLKSTEGLKEIATEGAKSYISSQVDASPMGPLFRFGLAAAGYPDVLKPPGTYTPQGKIGQWATSLGTLANSKVKGSFSNSNQDDEEVEEEVEEEQEQEQDEQEQEE